MDSKKIEPFDDGRMCNIQHILGMPAKEQEWIIKDLLPLKSIIYLAGDSGAGKSFLEQFLSLCAVSNRKVFNEFEILRKVNVLLIDVENRKDFLALRFKKLVDGNQIILPDDVVFNISYGQNINLDEDMIKKVERMIIKYNINLIILDSLVRFMNGNENNSQDASKVYEVLNPLVNNYDVVLLILHHTIKRGKGDKDDMRGSGEFSASADIVYTLSEKNVSGKKLKVLKQVKNRNAEPIKPIAYELVSILDDDGNQTGIKIVRDTTYREFAKRNIGEQAEDETIRWLNGWGQDEFRSGDLTAHLEEVLGAKYRKYNEILNKLESQGIIKKVKNGLYRKL